MSFSVKTSGSVAKCQLFSQALDWELLYSIYGSLLDHCIVRPSLRSRRLEVVGERENWRVRGKHARGVFPSRSPVFSCAHYFQALPRRLSQTCLICFPTWKSYLIRLERFPCRVSKLSPKFASFWPSMQSQYNVLLGDWSRNSGKHDQWSGIPS